MDKIFTADMTLEEADHVDTLIRAGWDLKPTGSRWFNPKDQDEHTDFDMYCPGDVDMVAHLISQGWHRGGSADRLIDNTWTFTSLRYLRLNIIMCLSDDFYNAFDAATKECKIKPPATRGNRIAIFIRHRESHGVYDTK